jgi:elongation factor Ts
MNPLDKVKEVRARSNVSLSACKRAITMTNGDVEQALALLKKEGLLKAADKAGRIATQGKLHSYIHGGGSKAALVEINCETDFAAKSTEFAEFCELVGLQIVGMSPTYLSQADVPNRVLGEQLETFFHQTPTDKPDAIRAKIADGKLGKWYSEVCLLDQECAAQPGKTIEQLRVELIAKIGENVEVRRFVRWELGEGIEKKVEDYEVEVAKLIEEK